MENKDLKEMVFQEREPPDGLGHSIAPLKPVLKKKVYGVLQQTSNTSNISISEDIIWDIRNWNQKGIFSKLELMQHRQILGYRLQL